MRPSVRPYVRTYVRTETALRVRECMCSLWAQRRATRVRKWIYLQAKCSSIRMRKLMWVNAVDAKQCACASLSAIRGLNVE